MLTGLAAAVVLIALGFGLNANKNRLDGGRAEAVALCEEGTEDLNAFRLRDAVAKLGQCLDLDPTLAEASISRTAAYMRLGETDNLAMELARADSLTGNIVEDQRRMIAQLRLSGFGKSKFHDQRDSILTRLDQEIPDNIFVLVAKASDARMKGDMAAEERGWKKILEVDPNYATAYNMLGYMELGRGNYDQAIDYMKKYAFISPGLANPHDSLGEVYFVLGRYEEAERSFIESVRIQPDFYHSLINLGRTYLARGQLEEGLEILEAVRSQTVGSEIEKRVDNQIVRTYLAAGLDDELARVATAYIGKYPDDMMSAFYRGVRLAELGRIDEGRAVMDSTMAHSRKEPWYDEYDEARRKIEAGAYQFEAVVSDVVGDHAAAAENWSKAIELFGPKVPFHEQWYARYRLARALHAEGRSQDALAEITPILRINPRIINLLVLKVECHLALQQGVMARATLENLDKALYWADKDFPARTKAAELALKVAALVSSR
jgi:tetratricopeptide (TPR) repeat protein